MYMKTSLPGKPLRLLLDNHSVQVATFTNTYKKNIPLTISYKAILIMKLYIPTFNINQTTYLMLSIKNPCSCLLFSPVMNELM